jgi:hypothetical protein
MIDAGPMPKGGWYPCEAFTVPSSKTIVTATYIPKSKTEKSLGIRSYVYASDAKAKAAFAVIQKKLSSCDGTSEFTSSESGPNTTRRTVTTGVDSNIEITGTEALYVYARDVPIAGVGNAARDAGGEYTLYVLANNTIMETGASQSGKVGYTSSQKAAVEELASAATETWGNAGN